VHALAPLGFNVILAEYPGYGGRRGVPSEDSLVEDARQTVRLAFGEFGSPLYLWGESLGCGVAAALAGDSSVPVDGLVLVTPWDSLTELARSLYWYMPVRLLLLDRFDSVKNLQDFKRPVAVVMALQDEIIPAARTLRLYEALNQPKHLWKFPAAGHNSWPTGPDEQWWGEVVQFVSSGGST
jgi:pimeloyl-ACP methyl ester carboxylesterase